MSELLNFRSLQFFQINLSLTNEGETPGEGELGDEMDTCTKTCYA